MGTHIPIGDLTRDSWVYFEEVSRKKIATCAFFFHLRPSQNQLEIHHEDHRCGFVGILSVGAGHGSSNH